MPAEQFANLAETTLAANYTAGQGFIQVTSAASFPSLPPFTVRLGNAGKTVFRVNWIYGSRFYGSAEMNDASATNGDAVTGVLSKASVERFLQAPGDASLAVQDRLFAPTGPGGAGGFGPMWKGGVPDSLSGWTWFQQGTSRFDIGGGVAKIRGQSAAGTQIRGRYTSLPSRPWRATLGIVPWFPPSTNLANLALLGIAQYESGTGKFIVNCFSNLDFNNGNATAGSVVVQGYTNSTSSATLYKQIVGGTAFNSFVATQSWRMPFGGIFWLRTTDDGTNSTYEYSWDGINWELLIKQSRTTGFTTAPDSLGIFWTLQSGSVSPADLGWVVAWSVDTPGGSFVPGTGALSASGQQVTRTP